MEQASTKERRKKERCSDIDSTTVKQMHKDSKAEKNKRVKERVRMRDKILQNVDKNVRGG